MCSDSPRRFAFVTMSHCQAQACEGHRLQRTRIPLNKMSLKPDLVQMLQSPASSSSALQNCLTQKPGKSTLVFNLNSQGASPCLSQGSPPWWNNPGFALLRLVIFRSYSGRLQESLWSAFRWILRPFWPVFPGIGNKPMPKWSQNRTDICPKSTPKVC